MKHVEPDRTHRMGRVSWCPGLVSVALSIFMLASSGISQAGGFAPPKECQSLTGDDHLHCLYSYIERQEARNDTVESLKHDQQNMLEQMGARQSRADERTAVADDNPGATVHRNEMPQAAPAPPSPSERITPSVGSPVECRAYSGAAHLNCLYAYIEIQNSKAGHVEEELKEQKHMLGQLRDQMDRQAAASQDLQRRLAEQASSAPSPAYVAPPIVSGYAYPYGYPWYGYPAPGLSLYLGVPGYYWGRPFYGPRVFGPRFYGHRHR